MIKDFKKQIDNKNIFVSFIGKNKLEIKKQGINEYSVFFKSQEIQNNWNCNCNSLRAILMILKAWKNDKKLIKKYHIFQW